MVRGNERQGQKARSSLEDVLDCACDYWSGEESHVMITGLLTVS